MGVHPLAHLQNPENRREILADDKLRRVFGKDKVTMFEMTSTSPSILSDGTGKRSVVLTRQNPLRDRRPASRSALSSRKRSR